MSPEIQKRAYDEAAAANYLSVSRSFLRQARMDGWRFPRTPGQHFLKRGRMIRYLKEDLDLWLEEARPGGGANASS